MSIVGSLKSFIYNLLLLANKPGNIHYYMLGISLPLIQELNVKWLQDLKFRTILDIGANVGQFAQAARAVFPHTRLYSFEPIPKCFEKERREYCLLRSERSKNSSCRYLRKSLCIRIPPLNWVLAQGSERTQSNNLPFSAS